MAFVSIIWLFFALNCKYSLPLQRIVTFHTSAGWVLYRYVGIIKKFGTVFALVAWIMYILWPPDTIGCCITSI